MCTKWHWSASFWGEGDQPFTKRQNFRSVQIESICRRQNKRDWKIEICFRKGGKHCGKKRKCWLPAFSPFPTMFSNCFFFTVVKSRDCVVKSYWFWRYKHTLWSLKFYNCEEYYIKFIIQLIYKKKKAIISIIFIWILHNDHPHHH